MYAYYYRSTTNYRSHYYSVLSIFRLSLLISKNDAYFCVLCRAHSSTISTLLYFTLKFISRGELTAQYSIQALLFNGILPTHYLIITHSFVVFSLCCSE